MIEERDLLALELVEPALLLPEVGDHRRHLIPVGGAERKDPVVNAPLGGAGKAVAEGGHRNLVLRDAIEQPVGDASGQGFDGRGAAVLLFEPLVALDPLGSVVLGLALLPPELDAVDAAALVDERPIVDGAAVVARAASGVRSNAIRQHGDELLVDATRLV